MSLVVLLIVFFIVLLAGTADSATAVLGLVGYGGRCLYRSGGLRFPHWVVGRRVEGPAVDNAVVAELWATVVSGRFDSLIEGYRPLLSTDLFAD